MLFLGIAVALLAGPTPAIGAITSSLQSILKNTHGSKDYGYPTDLTRDLLPIPVHSHNGVWDTVPDQTLYFFIDVKTSGPETFKAVIAALEPLRKKGYLTTVKDGKTVTNGPVTIIGTGETPLDLVAPVKDRDYFFDAPLANLNDPRYADITGVVSPVASTDFQAAVGKITRDTDPILTEDQLKALRDQISTANERGIGARYWNTPYFPVRARNLVWRTLLREGVFLLNADDLDAVSSVF
ncbi:uncharacterized protein N7529_003155 [Penicillium soppii]|uniref:uncharacterized protein n=1 Tax=Penicillium soppii TaxID=69789 RepID=UPI0025477317|nr:uncharacterized protein N7529_003155 [Penicillium soppii]KAJ5874725.1 hypothetical protein N7529_003155 [Penicillium soppii]